MNMRRPASAAAASFFLVLFSMTSHAHSWTDLLSPAIPTHAVNAGTVCAGVEATGRIATLAWPGAGAPGHVPVTATRSALIAGASWALARGEQTAFFTEAPVSATEALEAPEAPCLTLRLTCDSLQATATLTCAVSPTLPVLATRIRITGAGDADRLVWIQTLSPRPADSPPFPYYGTPPPAMPGFASFFDSRRGHLYQFRPAQAGTDDWDHALRLLSGNALPSEWSSFPDGTWCATAFSAQDSSCAFRTDAPDDRTEQAALGNASAVVTMDTGRVLPPGPMDSYLGFGKNRAEADAALDQAVRDGFDALCAAMKQDYATRLEPVLPVIAAAPQSRQRLERDLQAMFGAIDTRTGVLLGAPSASPALPATWPELAAWSALACHLAGLTELSQRQLSLFRAALPGSSGKEAGPPVFPALLRADGTSATPDCIHNPADTAWLVLGAVQILRHTPPDAATAAASAFQVELIAPVLRYLRRWSNPVTGGPSPGFDPARMRDTASVSNELLYYLALAGAVETANTSKTLPEPMWLSWRRDLDALLRFRLVNEKEGWALSPWLAAWAAMTMDPRDPLREAPVRTAQGTRPLSQCTIPTIAPETTMPTPNTLAAAADIVAILGAGAP